MEAHSGPWRPTIKQNRLTVEPLMRVFRPVVADYHHFDFWRRIQIRINLTGRIRVRILEVRSGGSAKSEKPEADLDPHQYTVKTL